MAPKHALAAASKPTKRRRRQASVRSFFAAYQKNSVPPEPCPSSPPPRAPPSHPVSIPSPPPLSPSRSPSISLALTSVSLQCRINVPPTHSPSELLIQQPCACVVDVPPIAAPCAPPRTSLRASMRLRSATRSSAPVSCPTPQHPIEIDSDSDANASSTLLPKTLPPPTSPPTLESDHDSEQPISRLSRRVKRALPKRPKSAPSSSSACSAEHPIFARRKSLSAPSAHCDTDNGETRPQLPVLPPRNAEPPAKKKLHPFFAATVAAVSSAKERSKLTKPPPPCSDAWTFRSSTIHVNAVLPRHPWHPKPQLHVHIPDAQEHPAARDSPQLQSPHVCQQHMPAKYLLPREALPESLSPFPVVHHASTNTNLWAEFYKKDSRIDVINGSAIKQLVDWLRQWYDLPDASNIDSDVESNDSYFMHEKVEKERVAVITGFTGCGKSTVIATAARHVGLSVLEINASTCRTGKRIREIIGDALNTHRVTHAQLKFSSSKKADCNEQSKSKTRTLIVFEDVDELQEDEKGFWPAFQKLVAAGDCRRPIVCTATTFSSQMRHIFVEEKRPFEADMERLFVDAKVEQALNSPPLPYKHICFTKRTERQSMAVLSRVSGSEAVKSIIDIKECLALLCRGDTRRAINLLQFWGSAGLIIAEHEQEESSSDKKLSERLLRVQERIGSGIVQAMLKDFATSIFHAGSRNYRTFMNEQTSRKATKSDQPSSSDGQICSVLQTWSESLDIFSSADLLRGQVAREKHSRNNSLTCCTEEVCMHSDLESLSDEANELDLAATHFSGKYLSFTDGSQQLRDICREATQSLQTLRHTAPQSTPYSRRSILSEYMPALRTMAVEHESKQQSDTGTRGGERYRRRTRSRSKKGGLSALDLDPETISTLRKTSIRKQESKTQIKLFR